MKVSKITFVALLGTAVFASCGDSKKKEDLGKYEYIRPATMEYSKQDTTEIYRLVNEYAENIKNQNIEEASRMLFVVRHDSVVPLSEEQRKGFVTAYTKMPVYDAQVESFVLRSDKNNQINVLVQIVKDGNIAERKGVSTIALNPVVKDGKWFLTLLDKNAEGVVDVYDPNTSNY